MNKIKAIERLQDRELEELTGPYDYSASWHFSYRDSAYVYIGGLPFEMNEGDVATVFSQFGEVTDVRLARDSKTGEPRGFCYLAYEDQRSTVLAIDGFNGRSICGRQLCVDHLRSIEQVLHHGEKEKVYVASGPDGRGWGSKRDLSDDEKALVNQVISLQRNTQPEKEEVNRVLPRVEEDLADEDERWERQFR